MREAWSKNLLLKSDPYKKNQVIFESSTPRTYNVEILGKGKYEVYCIAGGGGGRYGDSSRDYMQGGGSGSGFIGIIRINAGTLNVTVGAGGRYQSYPGNNSAIAGIVKTYGGGAGGGGGGAIPTLSVIPISTTLNSSGNRGETSRGGVAKGGASLYEGYGAGGDGEFLRNNSGKPGYIKVVYKG